VTAGYEFEREGYFDHLDDNLPAPDRLVTETRISQRSHAAFGAAQAGLMNRRLHVAISGRAQGFSLSTPRFSTVGTTSPYDGVAIGQPPRAITGDLSAAYFVRGTSTKLRAHVGNAYRAPALYERFGGGFFADAFTDTIVFSPFGDPRLAPDRYRSVDAGVDHYAWGDRAILPATLFAIDVRSLTAFDFTGGINPATDPFGRSSGYLNGSGGDSRGVELAADVTPASNLRLRGAYAYTRSRTDDDVTVPDFHVVPGVFAHTATFMLSHQWRDRLRTVVDIFHGSAHYGSFFAAGRSRAYRFPGFSTVGLTAAYRIAARNTEAVRAYVTVENLFDETYYQGGWRGLGRTAVAGVSIGR
jgi:iron complex outermembrane receptor protein